MFSCLIFCSKSAVISSLRSTCILSKLLFFVVNLLSCCVILLYLSALVFAYDYHPGAETLLMRHFSGPDSTLPVSPDGTLLFPSNPRSGGVPNRHRPGHRSPMPERLIWSYIIQLSSALRTVHAAGLACRVIDPSKVLLIGNSRFVPKLRHELFFSRFVSSVVNSS